MSGNDALENEIKKVFSNNYDGRFAVSLWIPKTRFATNGEHSMLAKRAGQKPTCKLGYISTAL